MRNSSYLPVYEDGKECSETSAYKIQTPGNYPEENIQHVWSPLILKRNRTSTTERIYIVCVRVAEQTANTFTKADLHKGYFACSSDVRTACIAQNS
jgi:hypothetical protein